MNRIAAFTLLEVVLAMVLTGVLVVLAYGVLFGSQQLAAKAVRAHNDLQELRSASRVIALDVDRSARVFADDEGFRCLGEVEVRYQVHGQLLLRTDRAGTDTVLHTLAGLTTKTRSEALPTEQGPLVEVVRIAAIHGNDSVRTSIRVQYDALTLIGED